MFCTNCGKEMANEATFCGHCGTQQAGTKKTSPIPVNNPPAVYAGFWKRVAAYLIDSIIVIIGSIPISILIGRLIDYSHHIEKLPAAILAQLSLGFVLTWFYFSWMEGSGKSATFGKRILGLKVARLDGTPLSQSVSTSIWRNFAKLFIVSLTFNVGIIIILLTPKKQALHDILAGTLVVNVSATQEDIAAAKPCDSLMTNKVAVALSLIGAVVLIGFIYMLVWVPMMDKPSPSRVAATQIPASGDSTSPHTPISTAAKPQDQMQWTQIGSSVVDNDITAQDYIDRSRIFQTPEGYFAAWVLSDFNKVQPHIPDKVDDLPQHASRLISIGIDCINARATTSVRLCALNMGKGKCVVAGNTAATYQAVSGKKYIRLPDSTRYEVQNGETEQQAFYRAEWKYPEAFGMTLEEFIRRRDIPPYIDMGKFAPIVSGSFERKIADAVCSR